MLPKLSGLRGFSPGLGRPTAARAGPNLGFRAGSEQARAAGPGAGRRGGRGGRRGAGGPGAPGPGERRDKAAAQAGRAPAAGPAPPHLSSQKVQGECSGTPPGSGRSADSCCRPAGGAAAGAAARGPGGSRAPAGGAAAGGIAIFSAPPARPADARTAGRAAAESPRPPPAPPRPPRPAPRAPRPGPALRPPGPGAAPQDRAGPPNKSAAHARGRRIRAGADSACGARRTRGPQRAGSGAGPRFQATRRGNSGPAGGFRSLTGDGRDECVGHSKTKEWVDGPVDGARPVWREGRR